MHKRRYNDLSWNPVISIDKKQRIKETNERKYRQVLYKIVKIVWKASKSEWTIVSK